MVGKCSLKNFNCFPARVKWNKESSVIISRQGVKVAPVMEILNRLCIIIYWHFVLTVIQCKMCKLILILLITCCWIGLRNDETLLDLFTTDRHDPLTQTEDSGQQAVLQKPTSFPLVYKLPTLPQTLKHALQAAESPAFVAGTVSSSLIKYLYDDMVQYG